MLKNIPMRWRLILSYAITCYLCMGVFVILQGESLLDPWWFSAPLSSVLLLATAPFAGGWNVLWWPAYAVVFVLCAIGTSLFGFADRQRRWRIIEGLCGKCGYDLRASKERCPECGTMIPADTESCSQTRNP